MSDPDVKSATPEGPPQKPGLKRWGKIALISSLALNLLFVGAIVGAGWMRQHHGSNWQGPPGFMVKRLLRHLPDDKRQAIMEQIGAHRKAMSAKIGEMQTRKKELKNTLLGEPFNPEKVRAAATRLKHTRRGVVDAKTEFLVHVLGQLSPDERRKILASRHFRHLFGRGKRWGSRPH